MKLQLDTIIIFVKDFETLKAFYTNIFHLATLEETAGEWLLLNAGHCSIGLHKIPPQYFNDGESVKFDNNTKLVFETDEDIYKLREYLLTKNVLVKEVKSFAGYGFLVCDGTDPEGNVFQIKQRHITDL